ncbi:tRNA (5-methylaminomethyl-2-thiouridine)(34)-methyltransferase MnmD [Dysgonomonas sp. 520]|uniref:tRNA (5-methylaminomethyl-2-thiouridine)(34)-methyltransferase MnmD n=1 Tax=Dysgonomonas sp. 520 TaxID=2302931 RepID=UPI0013D20AC9|nr:tRNA (5-methylaminomethyl-2-thiouridine)(34)-methyltransferase MnmD [Dysgonomonas sp. 520]NDW09884.1 SAM-dependent methyltransferase [Dysgonomonas sp. 520]
MSLNVRIEQTADGSDTLYVPLLNEHYHSVNGAIQESKHIFIQAGLQKVAGLKKDISILEIGFGTGLNTLLTLLEAEKSALNIDYTTLEYYPLPIDVVEKLNYTQQLQQDVKQDYLNLHTAKWNKPEDITAYFRLEKVETDFSRLDFNKSSKTFDLIYFDAFAPEKQGEMWSQEIFDYLYACTNPSGILTTYCAKGVVRRMMQQAGYLVERLPGPPGKREMLRAIR